MSFLKSFTRKHPFAIPLYRSFLLLLKELSFLGVFRNFKSLAGSKRFALHWGDRYPCFEDKTKSTDFDRHYIYHTAWAARILAKTRPQEHVDFSSCLYFSTLVSAFIPMRFYDYRPVALALPNLEVGHADLLRLPFPDDSIPSLSCMHVVEHIGLGRYGDPLDPEGDLKAIAELKRVTAEGGDLLFVVPIGHPKLMFNGHRIYSHEQILSYFSGLDLVEFTLISEHREGGGLIPNPPPEFVSREQYGCGCFWFRKGASR